MKRLLSLVLLLCLVCCAACADPLPLLEDYANTIDRPFEEGNPDSPRFVYSYRFPHVDVSAEGGVNINAFYEELVSYTEGFTIPMNMDAYEESDSVTDITYEVTCNDDNYFSVLVRTVQSAGERERVFYEGHVFSRKNGAPGQTWTLPKLLGILDSSESDTWLQDRQTAKADELVLDMVWERIEDNENGVAYDPELTRERLSHFFFPEEDYYLDADGNPVFILQPGAAAPVEAGLLTFPIPLEDILDEM